MMSLTINTESHFPTFSTADPAYYVELKKRAAQHRNNPTAAESYLWNFLCTKSIFDEKFRRQHILDKYIVDFVCLRKRLVIEIDGPYHFTPDQQYEDAIRTEILERLGFRVIRFTNDQVLYNIQKVLISIRKNLNQITDE